MSIAVTQHVYKLTFVVNQNVQDCITNQAERVGIVTVLFPWYLTFFFLFKC